jgi:hypothetical protein
MVETRRVPSTDILTVYSLDGERYYRGRADKD